MLAAAIFDVDGVLVDSPHEKAWREALRDLMTNEWAPIRPLTTWSPDAFTPLVYQQLVSGKPRLAGARDALAHFGVPDLDARSLEYGQRKQEMLLRLIDAGDFQAYPDALAFFLAVKDLGLRTAAASSSKNAHLLLQRIRLDTFAAEHGIASPTIRPGLTLLDAFDVDVSGRDFAHGKPHPDMFLAAAGELGVEPRSAVVLEDAAVGVQAAKAGDMAAIGIARFEDAALLAAAGADIVVGALDEVDLVTFAEGRLATGKARRPMTGRRREEGPA
jgi:beta-phosphoglucomutase-like phosphatase (HAD superfamily)